MTPNDLSLLHSPAPVHARWEDTILHWSAIASFWPGKLAAYEAQQLQHAAHVGVPCTHTLQDLDALRPTQTQAQHLAPANIVPAYAAREHVHIQTRDINPDMDVIPTGNCFLAAMPCGNIAVYDACGAYIAPISPEMLATCIASMPPTLATPSLIATAVRALLHEPLQKRKACSASQLFKRHFHLPECLLQGLQDVFN